MKEKLKNWKFMAIISGITLGLLLLSIYKYMYNGWIITIMAILFGISFCWFIWIWTKKDGIRKILSLLVCSSALTITFFLRMKNYKITPYSSISNIRKSHLLKDFSITMAVISGICIVTFLLLLIWKEPKKIINSNKTNNE